MYVRHIPEHPPAHPSAGRLGRRVHHDPRSLRYLYPAHEVAGLVSVRHERHIDVLDQGDLGACTGFAAEGALGTSPLWEAIPEGTPGRPNASNGDFDTDWARKLYSTATQLDDFDGAWPPTDTGSSGLAVAKACVKAGLISGYTHCTSLDAALKALSRQPVIAGINWYDCLPDGQRVLTTDLRWVPIEKLDIGDELIGFDEQLGIKAHYKTATVTGLGRKVRPVYEVKTDQGTVYASGGHLFAWTHPKIGNRWVRTDALKEGDRLCFMMHPYEQDTSWEAGWLAGFFDGEGTCSRYQLNVGQAVGPTLDRLKKILDAKGYGYTVKQTRSAGRTDGRGIISRKDLENLYIHGPHHNAMRFLGEVRPGRLIERGRTLWEDHSIRSRTSPPAIVQSVRYVGEDEVNQIGTTTKTLVTEGFLSHNCFDFPLPTGFIHIADGAQVRGGHEICLDEIDVARRRVWFTNSWGASWGKDGRACLDWDDFARLLHEDGDVTVFTPLDQPAPTPTPTPGGDLAGCLGTIISAAQRALDILKGKTP